MGAGLLMNGVLQLFVYPQLNRTMGAEALGALLFIMGIGGIIGPAVGQALNNSRLVMRRDFEVKNGDYDILLLAFGAAASLIGLAAAKDYLGGALEAAAVLVLFMLMIFRYYGDVEYRLRLSYSRYFAYYAVLTAGYVAGFAIYRATGLWLFIFLIGEAAALVFLAATGSVFRGFFDRSRFFSEAARRGGLIIISYTVTNLTLNIDRILLVFLIDSTAVTYYYVLSLVGKTMILLIAPINTIVISYLTKENTRLTRSQFLKMTAAGAAVALLFFLAAQVGTPIFVKLFYGGLYDELRPYMTVVNASQILGLLSAYIFILILTFTEEKWQMILQLAHLAAVLVLVFSFSGRYHLMGFSAAVLAANALRVAAVTAFGALKAGGGEKARE